jgi:hypothetical protein
MRGSIFSYSAPKYGNSPDEYEDAWCTSPLIPADADEIAGESIRISVADGASESAFAARWAHMLVDKFSSAPLAALQNVTDLLGALDAIGAYWPRVMASYAASRTLSGRPLKWYEERAIGSGAFATLLAADLTLPVSPASRSPDHDEGCWYAVSIGDTCMFQIRDDNLIGAFPAIPSSEFGNNPALVGSNHSDREFLRAHTLVHSGSVVQGDDFFMCTDALALWFTEQVEHGCKPWTVLRDLQSIGFPEWLADARRTGDLRNDDVTLIHVDVW